MEEFNKGDRVEFSDKGKKTLTPRSPNRKGIVVGQPYDPNLIRLRWDGTSPKSVHTYHKSFISVVLDDIPKPQPIILLASQDESLREILCNLLREGKINEFKYMRLNNMPIERAKIELWDEAYNRSKELSLWKRTCNQQ